MNITLARLVEEFAPLGLALATDASAHCAVTRISPVECSGPGDLVFMDRKDYLPQVASRRPAAVICTPRLKALVEGLGDIAVLTTPNVALAHALIKQRYANREYQESGWDGVHASAVIHPSATVGADTVIEPRVVIGRNAVIGQRCRIMAGVVIENDVTIGDDTIVHPSVVIGYGCRIGRQVEIGSGSVIGSEGFGFAQDAGRRSHPIPQTGIVVIGDRVRIGANNCIDRATYRETCIGAGTKFDNLCHVAHNVEIGDDCLLTAMFCVAGSSKVPYYVFVLYDDLPFDRRNPIWGLGNQRQGAFYAAFADTVVRLVPLSTGPRQLRSMMEGHDLSQLPP